MERHVYDKLARMAHCFISLHEADFGRKGKWNLSPEVNLLGEELPPIDLLEMVENTLDNTDPDFNFEATDSNLEGGDFCLPGYGFPQRLDDLEDLPIRQSYANRIDTRNKVQGFVYPQKHEIVKILDIAQPVGRGYCVNATVNDVIGQLETTLKIYAMYLGGASHTEIDNKLKIAPKKAAPTEMRKKIDRSVKDARFIAHEAFVTHSFPILPPKQSSR